MPIGYAAVDLFCGIGGLTHGLFRAGIPVAAGIDIDATCQFAFESNNRGARFVHASVTDLSASQLLRLFPAGASRILVGCAPCQPFSNYTNRYPRDSRWGLLYAFQRLIRGVRPEIVSMENVPELSQRRHKVYSDFLSALSEDGYYVESKVVRCADYGVPQRRERLVLLASRLGPIKLIPPTHPQEEWVRVREAIGALPAIVAGGPAPLNDPLHVACRLSDRNLDRIRATPEGGGWRDWPAHLRLACHLKSSGSQYLSVYGRMRWDDLAPTMTTQCYGYGNGRFGHPSQNRAISLREAALLQTFPPHYRFAPTTSKITFKHVGKHIGNSVPVALARAIGSSIATHLSEHRPTHAAKRRARRNASKLSMTSSR